VIAECKKKATNVRGLAVKLGLWQQIIAGVESCCAVAKGKHLLDRLAVIPVVPSRASRRLGCYAFRGSEPVCIRLQFMQEPENLRQTFLHEIAHACDHLNQHTGRQRRVGHGTSWRQWAFTLGIESTTTGSSAAVAALYQRRQKLVAICMVCGAEIYRVRRLNCTHRYIHPACGGVLKQL
jgi:predicted SprT family Zn-dependent metalloprotease